MKKVLLGTAAIFAMSGAAYAGGHAELSISVDGSSDLWISDSGAAGSDPQVNVDLDIIFSASGETDGGLGFGFDYAIQNAVGTITDSNSDTASVGAPSVDDWEVYISGSWGELRAGDPDDALQSVAGIGDIGFDGLGVDNVAEQSRGDGDSDGVLYSNTIGSVSVYLSHNRDLGNDDISAGVSFDAGPVTIGLGYEDDGGADITALDVSGSFSSVSFDIYYEDADATDTSYGIILGYDAGDVTVELGYADSDAVADAAVGIGFEYDLGGGASLAGGVADNGTDTAWDLGIAMTF